MVDFPTLSADRSGRSGEKSFITFIQEFSK